MDRAARTAGVAGHLPIVALIALSLAACAPQVGPDARLWPVEAPTTALDLQATRRGVFFREGGDGSVVVCAEPAPDVAVSSDTAFATGLTIPQIANITEGQAALELDATTTQQLVDLANRGQLLQVQREALYRLCELQANSGLSNVTIFELYDEVLFTIRIFAMSDVLTALSESDDGRALVGEFLTAAITRSTRPSDLIGSGVLSPDVARVLFSAVSPGECVRLRAASDASLDAEMSISTDPVFVQLADELDDPLLLREGLEALCSAPAPR